MNKTTKKPTLTQQKSDMAADRTEGGIAVLAKIAVMLDPYRAMGERLHALIKVSAPALSPKVWYGMPGYAKDDRSSAS